VQKHIKEQDQVNPELAELAKKLGVGLVATNDVHFLERTITSPTTCSAASAWAGW
jgi:DNA polymerase III alpha subunit